MQQELRCMNWKTELGIKGGSHLYSPKTTQILNRELLDHWSALQDWLTNWVSQSPQLSLHYLKLRWARRAMQWESLYLQTSLLLHRTCIARPWVEIHIPFLLSLYREQNQIDWFKFLPITKKHVNYYQLNIDFVSNVLPTLFQQKIPKNPLGTC